MANEQPKPKKFEKPKGPSIFARIKNKIAQYRRVLSVARKPDRDEYFSTMKITGTSLLLVGSIGFIIFLLYYLVRGLVF
ncbi:MAG: protein translocase SEC61 complex subunit gamma [Candidatus Heimdallarchaeaceae archaeon]|jgi:protein translocase SEC61 complex gamma subunit